VTGSRTVLVTGANSGIGLATALELARLGFRTVGSVRSESKAETLTTAAQERGLVVETILLDVTDAARCAEVIEEVRPWGLVNNAGFEVTGAVEDVGDETARHALETMVVAPMRLARLAIPHMRETGGGSIVNVSSIYGRFTTPLTGWYQASKHALEAVSDALRMEVSSDGIRVSIVEPGGFRTEIFDDVSGRLAGHDDSRYRDAYQRSAQTIRLWRPLLGDPARVAKVIATAMTTRMPRTRYLVGPDAQAAALAARFIPTSVKDLAARLTLGL